MSIHGYQLGTAKLAASPISIGDLRLLEQTVLFGEDDRRALGEAAEALEPQIEEILDVWYGFVGANAQLIAHFSNSRGEPQPEYLAAVRRRFGQWIRDTCTRPYDQAWLDWQHEIALRHHSLKKNRTDQADSTPIIPLSLMVAFIYPITATLRPFLEKSGKSAEDVDRMWHAWFKAVTLTVVLWIAPYARDGEF